MGCWSAENATKAYLKTIKMGERPKEPDVAEFISALAAGHNSQLMIVASATTASCSATLGGLVAAAHQTGGRVICIIQGPQELNSLGCNVGEVEFIIGEAQSLLLSHYREADLVVIDCNLENHEGILGAAGQGRNGRIVLGYNAFCKESWRWSSAQTQLLPIGEGLLLSRIAAKGKSGCNTNGGGRSHWVVKVDKCTGEEHVFRVRSYPSRVIKA